MERVGRRYEEDLGKIIVQVQVVIVEGKVLLGIQDFKQGGGWVAPEVHAHLVDFVEAESRVVALDLPEDWMILPGRAPM